MKEENESESYIILNDNRINQNNIQSNINTENNNNLNRNNNNINNNNINNVITNLQNNNYLNNDNYYVNNQENTNNNNINFINNNDDNYNIFSNYIINTLTFDEDNNYKITKENRKIENYENNFNTNINNNINVNDNKNKINNINDNYINKKENNIDNNKNKVNNDKQYNYNNKNNDSNKIKNKNFINYNNNNINNDNNINYNNKITNVNNIHINNNINYNNNKNNKYENKSYKINKEIDINLIKDKNKNNINKDKNIIIEKINKDNYNNNITDKNININKKPYDDRAFKSLKELQTLYKKESALKELFVQTSSKIKTNINEYSKDLYKKKLDVLNISQKINEDCDQENQKKSILYEDKSFLGNLNNYVPKFMTYLWENPKFVAEILMNAEIQDVKEYLAPFISNNFYENILSPNYIEDYLMYVMCILLKDEISKMQSHSDFSKFLCSTTCGYILRNLYQKSDIQEFFKNILEDVIEQIEVTCSSRKMTFKLKEIEEQIQEKHKEKKNKNKSSNKYKKKMERNTQMLTSYDTQSSSSTLSLSLSFASLDIEDIDFNFKNKSFIEREEDFSKIYSIPMNKNLLEDIVNQYKNSEETKIYEYLKLQLNKMGEDKNIYSNNSFKEKAYTSSENPNEILYSYQQDFIKIIVFIEEILEKLLNNFHYLPYSIKCLCKIISIFIRKKFPKITTVEENAFISQFFFYNLFVPFFENPSTIALINNFIISNNTIHNLKLISYIILQLTSGNFFTNNLKNGDFTFFNRFFIEEMPKLLKIFDKLTKVELPPFIEKFINDQLPSDYKYDYFKENPDQLMFHRTICYNLYDLSSLIDNIDNCKNKLFTNDSTKIFEKTFEKLNSKTNRNLIATLKKSQKKEIIQKLVQGKGKKPPELKEFEGKKQIYHFLETELLCNEKYSKLFSITQKTPHFSIKELKKTSNEEEEMKNNIIKVKNFFSALLCNYMDLVKKDFNENSISNIKDILKELKIFLKSSNFVVDGKIPTEWYATSLIEYLDKIPKELTNNNCEKLFREIQEDLNKSLKELDFEALSVCLSFMKFSQRGITYYEKAKEILIDIELNNKVKKIIEEEIIPVSIEFKYSNKIKEFKISKKVKEKQIYMLDDMVFENKKKKPILCDTIQTFTKRFPNLSKYQVLQDLDLFAMQEELKIPERLDEYFNIIKDHLLLNKKIIENEELCISNEKTMQIINEKIYDYVMVKLYDKIYPRDTDQIDNWIFSQSIRLSWTEPKNFIKQKKNFVYDTFLPDVIYYFKQIDVEKSPRKKLINMSNIFKSITNLVDFNNGEEKLDIGVDDQMPILNYFFIKAQPERIYSNCRYMDLYIGDKRSKQEGSQLSQLLGIIQYVKDLNYDSLFDVTEEEFNLKCNKAAANQI